MRMSSSVKIFFSQKKKNYIDPQRCNREKKIEVNRNLLRHRNFGIHNNVCLLASKIRKFTLRNSVKIGNRKKKKERKRENDGIAGDVQAVARIQGAEEIRDGVRYLKVARMLVDFGLGRARFRVVDQLNGDNVIGQAMNQFLNQNAKEIIEEMRPAASASIAKHFKNFLGKALNKVPLKVWLRDT